MAAPWTGAASRAQPRSFFTCRAPITRKSRNDYWKAAFRGSSLRDRFQCGEFPATIALVQRRKTRQRRKVACACFIDRGPGGFARSGGTAFGILGRRGEDSSSAASVGFLTWKE